MNSPITNNPMYLVLQKTEMTYKDVDIIYTHESWYDLDNDYYHETEEQTNDNLDRILEAYEKSKN